MVQAKEHQNTIVLRQLRFPVAKGKRLFSKAACFGKSETVLFARGNWLKYDICSVGMVTFDFFTALFMVCLIYRE